MRDFLGYSGVTPDIAWPGGARLAVVLVLNLEEGAEPSIPDGDPATDIALTDAIPGEVPAGTRDLVAESLFEYGARAGVWRILREMDARGLPLTLSACAQSLLRNSPLAEAIRARPQHEVMAHGNRFLRHWTLDEATQRAEIAAAVTGLETATGRRPIGWQSRYSPSTYDADGYADDVPYWVRVGDARHLIIPHSFVHNDNRFMNGRIQTADDFLAHLRSALFVLRDEARAGLTRMMTVSLHARVSGQPARFDVLRRFLDLLPAGAWVTPRAAIAHHWIAHTKDHL
ncbi:MAG: polysaccharide deacetylase family protein [Alphaproteobacteria bacterium]|nr:polysaccharide deacetylase family protein [Alphaproteobacteria bacterium]